MATNGARQCGNIAVLIGKANGPKGPTECPIPSNYGRKIILAVIATMTGLLEAAVVLAISTC